MSVIRFGCKRNRCGNAHDDMHVISEWRRLHLYSVTMLLGRCTCGSSRKKKGPGQKGREKAGPRKEGSEAHDGQKGRQAGTGTEVREAGSGAEGCEEAGSGEEGSQEAGSCEEGGEAHNRAQGC